MKKMTVIAAIEFYRRDDETEEEAIEVAKNCIEASIGKDTVIRITGWDAEDGDKNE